MSRVCFGSWICSVSPYCPATLSQQLAVVEPPPLSFTRGNTSTRYWITGTSATPRDISTVMLATCAQETCARNLCKKIAWKIWRKFTVSCTTTAGRPITLHGLCPGTELRAVFYCVQETCTRKNLYKIDWHTCKFLVQVSWVCVAGLSK